MRRYPLIWFWVLLLLAAGVFFYLRQSHISENQGPGGTQSRHRQSSAAAVATAGAAKAASASARTNEYSWRLSNTTNSLARLIHDPHAILLENAFIETDSRLNLSIPRNLQAQGDPGAYLVQARGPVSSAFRAILAAAGATIVSYIPNDAYLVRASEAVANALAANPLVQAVLPYEPYYKVQAPLLSLAEQPLPQDEQLTLGLFADDASDTVLQIQKLGGIILSEENSAAGYPIVKVEPPPNWTPIAALPGVHIVEPYYHRSQANDLARAALKVAANSITGSNYLNLYGSNVIIEVNDTGIDTNHPDFSNNHTKYRVFYTDPEMGVDTNGHGTHVAGIIAGDGYESTTVTNAPGSPMPGANAQFRGKAPMAEMLSMNYQDSDQELQEAAAETNALISNNSWVNGDFDYDLEAANYDAATRDALPFVSGAQPVLFVFAAGDDGNGGIAGTVESPGTAKDVITVGALEEFRYLTNQVTDLHSNISQPWISWTINSNSVWGYSSDGNVGVGTEGTFGRFKPDVVAPGTFVVSCRSEQWDTNAYYHPTNNTYYDFPDLIPTDSVSVVPFEFYVPTNAVEVIFRTVTNQSSPPVLPGIPIYLQTNQPNPGFSFIGSNEVAIAPAPQTLNEDWSVEASNVTTSPLAYDLIVDVQTTNGDGNYYQVLQGMNDGLGPPGNYYRYESGTSMSAPAIAGFLALIQDYFTNQYFQPFIPSPALLKAMLINGARQTAGYELQVNNTINYEGWGLPNLSNSIPATITNVLNAPCSSFFRDQSPTNALATGDQETFMIALNTNNFGNYLPLRATLAWTDPPGDPAAALKLVNSLELVVTDMDNPGVVYYGNDIGGSGYNNVENATNAPIVDTINNVQDVLIRPYSTNRVPDAHYSVTVIGN
ncbi:MAG: S8 family serine peptidase, partial [Limisphaerales bacterium]